MSNVTVQARISPELKQEVDAILSTIGLTTAEAIRVFLTQVVNSGGLPFQPTAKAPNYETLQAMKELEDGGGELFATSAELFEDWTR